MFESCGLEEISVENLEIMKILADRRSSPTMLLVKVSVLVCRDLSNESDSCTCSLEGLSGRRSCEQKNT